MATVLCLLIMGVFAALYVHVLMISSTFRKFIRYLKTPGRSGRWIAACGIPAILILGFCFCRMEVLRNHFIYCWDYGDYWTRSYQQMQNMYADPVGTFRALVTSVRYDEYNLLLPTLLALPLHLFGYTFERYVLICCVFFLMPALIAQALCCARMIEILGLDPWDFYSTDLKQEDHSTELQENHRMDLRGKRGEDLPQRSYEVSRKESRGTSIPAAGSAILLACAALFPVNWFALLRGYIDAGSLTAAALMLLLLLEWEPESRSRIQFDRDLTMALLMLLAFVERRYFAYYGIGIGAGLAVISASSVFRNAAEGGQRRLPEEVRINNPFHERRDVRKTAVTPLLHLFITAGSMAVVMLVFFRPLVQRSLGGNYAGQYAAYDLPMLQKLSGLISRFGWLTIVLAFAGVILARSARMTAVFVSALVTTAAFFSVQAFGIHHAYLITCQLLVLRLAGIFCIVRFIADRICSRRNPPGVPAAEERSAGPVTEGCNAGQRKLLGAESQLQILSNAVLLIALCIALLDFGACYLPKESTAAGYELDYRDDKTPGIFAEHYEPLVRGDIKQLRELTDTLRSLTNESGKNAYVLAGSFVLNADILQSIGKPDVSAALGDHLMTSADVDLRDGFPSQLFDAAYIVTTDPPQAYLPDGTQDVIVYPSMLIADPDSAIGKHYEALPQRYQLDGAQALIYRKISELTPEDREAVAAYYDRKYPGLEYLFRDRIVR